eukprot:scaffold80879_cov58-Phaeocystis_antarctica.AAC.2
MDVHPHGRAHHGRYGHSRRLLGLPRGVVVDLSQSRSKPPTTNVPNYLLLTSPSSGVAPPSPGRGNGGGGMSGLLARVAASGLPAS